MAPRRYFSFTPSLASVTLLTLYSCGGGTKGPPQYAWFYELDDAARAAAVVKLEPDTQVDHVCSLATWSIQPAPLFAGQSPMKARS
jgi:hypothetical protein